MRLLFFRLLDTPEPRRSVYAASDLLARRLVGRAPVLYQLTFYLLALLLLFAVQGFRLLAAVVRVFWRDY
jgi:hypothetical protein